MTRTTMREFAPLLAADVVEGVEDFHVHVDLPGVIPEDLDVNIAGGYLNIKAERRQIHDSTLGLSHNIERSYGRISRSVELPARADPEHAKANFKDGVLSVSFRKLDEVKFSGKKLAISS